MRLYEMTDSVQIGRYSKGPRYWYHNLFGRTLNDNGGIDPYPLPRGEQELARDFRKALPANDTKVIYLSQTPLMPGSLKIDISKLDTVNNMIYTGQAEGYAIYRGVIPKEAIVNETV